MKKVKLTEAEKQTALEVIKQQLDSARSTDGKFTIDLSKTSLELEEPIVVNFSALAWLKMQTLVDKCSKECAWHGIVNANEERTRFNITDIMVYPQEITGATVTCDHVEYTKWAAELPDEVFNNMRFQGHSHVRMACNPSGTDNEMYHNILQTMSDDGFYIFMICNKSGKYWVNVQDLRAGVVYESVDIDVTVEGLDLDTWYEQQEDQYLTSKVKKNETPKTTPATTTVAKPVEPVRTQFGNPYYGGNYGPYGRAQRSLFSEGGYDGETDIPPASFARDPYDLSGANFR